MPWVVTQLVKIKSIDKDLSITGTDLVDVSWVVRWFYII